MENIDITTILYSLVFFLTILTLYFFISWKKAQVKAIAAQANLDNIGRNLDDVSDRLEAQIRIYNQEHQSRIDAETNLKLISQENQMLRNKMADWEKTKQQHLEAAKSSMLEASSKLSSKLLDDHKREAEAYKKENQESINKTTQELQQKFQNVFESMKSLSDQVSQHGKSVDLVRNSLLNPAGAGALAEITLENIFKASNLIPKQDYNMQHWIADGAGSGLKPDAIVYLPCDNIMVIDSKSSKFFLELGAAENDVERKKLEQKLKESMNNHLKDLMKRDYQKAAKEQACASNSEISDPHVTVFMFLPTESALENLRNIDSNFIDKAWKARILPVSPTGLVNILLQAEMIIANSKQEQNTKIIINEVQSLINSIAIMHQHADGLGANLRNSLKKYDKFAASFNSRFLSKISKLEALGVNDSKNKEYKKLERFQLVENNSQLIEDVENNIKELDLIG